MRLSHVPNVQIDSNLNRTDKLVYKTQCAIGGLLVLESVLGLATHLDSNLCGTAMVLGSIAGGHAITMLTGGYHNIETPSTPDGTICNEPSANATLDNRGDFS